MNITIRKLFLNIFMLEIMYHETVSIELITNKEAENDYLSWANEFVPNKDYLCDMEVTRKLSVCNYVFNQQNYSDVYINKAAYFNSNPTCIYETITFHTNILQENKTVQQKMLPCYGRHNTVTRTSFVIDDYFNKFFLSTGPKNSLFVFIRTNTINSTIYSVHNFLQNFSLENLPSLPYIKPKDVTYELTFTRKIYSIEDKAQLEEIFMREVYKKNNELKDPLHDMDGLKIYSICEQILNRNFHKNVLNMKVNKMAYFVYYTTAEEHILELETLHQNTISHIQHKMYPCFARHPKIRGNVLKDSYLRDIFISSGARRNSIFVYIRDPDSNIYHLFQYLENLNLHDIKPVKIKVDEVCKESSISLKKLVEIVREEENKSVRLAIHEIYENL